MPTRTHSPDKYTHALVTIRSLYETYVAASLPAPVASIVDTLISGAIQAQPLISQSASLFRSLILTLSGSNGGGSAESTALISTAVMIITLYVSLRLFSYVRRLVVGWIIFAVKFIFLLFAVQVVFYINKYGWENALRDASWWGGLLWGFLEDVLDGDRTGTPPRGTRSRASTKRGRQYGSQGRDQVPLGGRTRWT